MVTASAGTLKATVEVIFHSGEGAGLDQQGEPQVLLCVVWEPAQGSGQKVAVGDGGSAAGIVLIKLSFVWGPPIVNVMHQRTTVDEEAGHPNQHWEWANLSGRAPQPGEVGVLQPGPGQQGKVFEVGFYSFAAHNGPARIRATYRFQVGGMPPQFVEGDRQITVTWDNLLVEVVEDADHPAVLQWDPLDPTGAAGQTKNRIQFSLTDLQQKTAQVVVRIYPLDRVEETPLRTFTWANVTAPGGPYEWIWDGRNDAGQIMLKGLYPFDVYVHMEPGYGYNSDRKQSAFLTLLGGLDGPGQPVAEAEYLGYDEQANTQDFLVRYGLKCGSVQWDNEGDHRWDEDPPDGVDNDQDGAVDEDGPDPADASAGEVRVYDPDFEVQVFDLSLLTCQTHGTTDGLHATLEGVQHAVVVKVPAGFMEKAGDYHFVLRARDAHGHLEKAHREKWALERNQRTSLATTVNFDFTIGYYRNQPYATHNSDVYTVPNPQEGNPHFQLPYYADDGRRLGWVTIISACHDALVAQQSRGYGYGPFLGQKTDGSRGDAITALKKGVALFSFNGHALTGGNPGGMAFYRKGDMPAQDVWEILLGAPDNPPETPPNGMNYAYLRNELGRKRLEVLLFGLVLGCHTAHNPQGSVLYEMINKGAACDAGFEVTVYTPEIIAFHVYFWDLAMGYPNSHWLSTPDRTPHAVYAAARRACRLTEDACVTQGIQQSLIPKIDDFYVYSRPGVDGNNLMLVPARDGRRP